jgi:translation initiation factor 5A
MAWSQAEVRELKEGRYVNVEEEPCKILSIQMSKPGKHGEAKARIDCVGLFDERKRSIVHPVTHKVQVPMIDKRKAQILAIGGDEVQLMDLENYENFSLAIPDEFKGQLHPGEEIMYMIAMGRRKITKV